MREKYLLLWAACAAALGIWLGESAAVSPLLAGMAGLFCLGAAFIFHGKGRETAAFLFFLGVFAAVGWLRMGVAEERWENQSQLAGASGIWDAVVTEEPAAAETPVSALRYPVELFSVTYADGSVHEVRGTAWVYIPREEGEKEIPPDTRLSVEGELTRLRLYKNPGKMDLENRYKSRRLIGRIYTKNAGEVTVRAAAGEYRASAFAAKVKAALREKFSPYIDGARLSLLMTLLFGGNYEKLPAGALDSFTVTGIVHILSVSGSHIALLLGFLCLLGKWLGFSRRVVFPFAVLAILGYAALAGFVPPVIRASLMGTLAVLGLFCRRGRESLLLLAAAVLLMLLWEPFYLFDVSFQLSALASAGILIFYRPLCGWLRKFCRAPAWLAEGASLSVSAQLLTIPIILYDFHRLSLYFLPANLFVTPLLEWSILLGLAASLFIWILAPLAGGALQLADYFLLAALRMNGFLAALPYAVLPAGALSVSGGALYYGVLFLAVTKKFWASSRKKFFAAAAFLFLIVLGNLCAFLTRPSAELFVPDLGVHRAAVLAGKKETAVWYRDGGLPFDLGKQEMLSVLGYKGIFSVDIFIGDFSRGKDASPFTLALPIREIWLTPAGAAHAEKFLAAHPESRVRKISAGTLRTAEAVYETDGKNWHILWGDTGIYLDAGGPAPALPKAARRVWLTGADAFQGNVNGDKMKKIQPSFVIYAGSRLPQAGEDRDLFEFYEVPYVDTYLDGMAEVEINS